MSRHLFVFLLVLATRSLLADDFKTIEGKEFKNVTVSRVEPDGIVLITSAGISKVYFNELPKEVQERFHYDAVKAAAYSAQQNANLEALRKQQQETKRQAAEVKTKNDKYAAEQLAADESARNQRNNIQALQAHWKELSQQEDDLLRRIGEIQTLPDYVQGRSGRRQYSYKNPARADLPLLQSHLDDVRREKDKVGQRIEQAQHQ